jgi:hypothetical protein
VVSDPSGVVGMVRGKWRGIFESAQTFSVRVHFGPPTTRGHGGLLH